MEDYEKSLEVLEELFGVDHQFTLSTLGKAIPSVRYVDSAYYDGAFYIVTRYSTKKVRDIETDPNVILNNNLYNFSCTAENIGHPLKKENAKVREILKKTFSWYDKHCDEQDSEACFLKLTPLHGFYHYGGKGYDVDFIKKTAKIFPFDIEAITYSQMGYPC